MTVVFVLLFITVAWGQPTDILESDVVFNNDYVPCETGWYYFREKCYKAFGHRTSERLSWNKALDKCIGYGGFLLSIHSQEEQDFITSFLQLDVKASVWIGLNDLVKKSIYGWPDASAVNYTNWEPGEPSGGEEHCVHMVFNPEWDEIGQWNDRVCDFSIPYVCQMKPNPIRRSPNPMYCSPEEGGGWKYENSCYQVVTERKSWQDSEKLCKDVYNGHVVDILDIVEDHFLDYIAANIREGLWIGIKTKNQLQQQWSSGWHVSYNRFNKEQLNLKDGSCVARKNRKEWITVPCTDKLPFICKVSKASPPVLKPPVRGSYCPVEHDEWRDLGGEYCYYFEKEKDLTSFEALFDCTRRGGSLASLHSKEETEVLFPFVKYTGNTFFIGLFRRLKREEEFAWTDGSEFNYENWRTGEPNNLEEKCVEVLSHYDPDGTMLTWNDIRCGEKRRYICSVRKKLPNSTSEEDAGCTSFCIPQSSYLYGVVTQNKEATRCKTRCELQIK